MAARYVIFVRVGGKWELAAERRIDKSGAFGLLNQFAMQYDCRLFRGEGAGKLVATKSKGV